MKKHLFFLIPILALTISCGKDEPIPDDPNAPAFDYEIGTPQSLPYEFAGADMSNTYYNPEENNDHIIPLLTAVGSLVVKQAELGVVNKILSYPINGAAKFFESLFGIEEQPDPNTIKLDQIIESLDEVNQRLDKMYNQMKEIQGQIDETEINLLATQVQAINEKTTTMYYHNLETYDLIVSALKSDDPQSEIKSILTDWAKTVINGSEARINALSYVDYLINPLTYFTYHSKKINLLQVYDLTVFDAYPWEHLGYRDREMFRAKMATEAVLSLSFAYAYYQLKGSTTMASTCEKAIGKLVEFMEANEIVYDEDHATCQIRGAFVSIAMKPVLDRTKTIPTDKDKYFYENEWLFGLFNTTTPSNTSDEITALRDSQMTTDELDAIVNYFKKVSPEKSLLKIFADAGIQYPEDYQDNTDIYIGSSSTNTCLWPFANSRGQRFFFSEFNDVYNIGVPVKNTEKMIGYFRYAMDYSFTYPDDYYMAEVHVPGYSGEQKHYRRWKFDFNGVIFYGPGKHFFFLDNGNLQRYADFNIN